MPIALTPTCRRRAHESVATVLLTASLVLAAATCARAQPSPAPIDVGAAVAAAAEQSHVSVGPPVTLTYANRPIMELRASFLGRPPAERVEAAQTALDRLVKSGVTSPVEARVIGGLTTIAIDGRYVFSILPDDIDTLAGETLPETAAQAASRLQTALDEVNELHQPRRMLAGALQALVATLALIAIVWLLRRAHGSASRRLCTATTRRLQASAVGDLEFVRASRILEFLQHISRLLAWLVGLGFAYVWLTFTLRRFPFTRPWGESMHERLMGPLSLAASAIVHSLPKLLTLALIVLLTRFATHLVRLFFQAVEDGRITVKWAYKETAQSTRRLVSAALWLAAMAIAYPYLPGSQSEAFKGLSLFIGVILSFGSSGLVTQLMSGLTLTYSRAFRPGDVVAVGDVHGTVMLLGALSTKVRTCLGEEVTIPNALAVSQIVTNYTRLAETDGGVYIPTNITIGYDVPWRQVQALLLLAATRTPGVLREPAPFVRKAALEDFYVKYTLLLCPERPAERLEVLTAVHANILDAFNEYGVQIMSPRYETDADAPKVVPRDRWYTSPASRDAQAVPKAS